MNRKLDPYGFLEWAIGSGDDFVCFDYEVDDRKKVVRFASCLNSETGHSIQNFEDEATVPINEAVAYARGLVDRAIDWCHSEEPFVRLDMKGWNQDPTYFVRCVAASLASPYVSPKRRERNWRNWL